MKHIFQGKYECVATNSVGTEYSYSAQLYVRGMWEQKLHLFPAEYYQNFLQFVECRHTSPSDLRQSMRWRMEPVSTSPVWLWAAPCLLSSGGRAPETSPPTMSCPSGKMCWSLRTFVTQATTPAWPPLNWESLKQKQWSRFKVIVFSFNLHKNSPCLPKLKVEPFSDSFLLEKCQV